MARVCIFPQFRANQMIMHVCQNAFEAVERIAGGGDVCFSVMWLLVRHMTQQKGF